MRINVSFRFVSLSVPLRSLSLLSVIRISSVFITVFPFFFFFIFFPFLLSGSDTLDWWILVEINRCPSLTRDVNLSREFYKLRSQVGADVRQVTL